MALRLAVTVHAASENSGTVPVLILCLPDDKKRPISTARDEGQPLQLPCSAIESGVVSELKLQRTFTGCVLARTRTDPRPAHLPSSDWRKFDSWACAAPPTRKTSPSACFSPGQPSKLVRECWTREPGRDG